MSIEKLKSEWAKLEGFIEDSTLFEIIECGDWICNGKYQTCSVIVKENGTENYYRIDATRIGSYHSDYEYYDPDFYKVNRIEETKTVISYIKDLGE